MKLSVKTVPSISDSVIRIWIILIETIRLYNKCNLAIWWQKSSAEAFLAALGGGGRGCGGWPPPGHGLRALGTVFVVRLELHLQEVPVLLADDLTDEPRQGLQVTQQGLQLCLQHGNPLLHVLLPLIQVWYHVIHDVLSLEQQREAHLARSLSWMQNTGFYFKKAHELKKEEDSFNVNPLNSFSKREERQWKRFNFTSYSRQAAEESSNKTEDKTVVNSCENYRRNEDILERTGLKCWNPCAREPVARF